MTRKHACARCGFKSSAESMVYSRVTGKRYCGPKRETACATRARRLRKVSHRDPEPIGAASS
jgi:hypothetical protein